VTHAASHRGSCHTGQPRNGDLKAMTLPSRDGVGSGRYCLFTEHHDPGFGRKFLQTGEMPPVPLRAEKHGR
jgi:hypothetical protein